MQYEKVLPSIFKTALQNNDDLTYHTVAGCQDRSFRKHISASHTNTETQWDIQTPGAQTLMNKRVMCSLDVTVSVTGTTPAFPIDFKLRPFAPLTAITSLFVGLNGNQKDYPVSELIPVLSRYNNNWTNADAQWAGIPVDQDYSFLYNTAATGASVNIPRNSTVFMKSDKVSGVGATAVRTRVYRLRFPLMGPGLNWGQESDPDGLTLLNKLIVRIQWASNLSALMFSHTAAMVGDNVLNATTLVVGEDKPSLFIEYVTPTVDLNKSVIAYNIKHYQPHRTAVGVGNTAANTAFGPVQSSTISFQTVPNAIYVYVREDPGAFRITDDPMVFADLTNVQIQWRNKTISYQADEMFMLGLQSIANGCNIPLAYQNTSGGSDETELNAQPRAGAVYKFVIGKDLPLEPDLFAGSNTGSGMTVQVQVYGVNRHNSRPLSLYVLVEMDQTMYLSPGQSVTEDGFPSNVTQELSAKPFLPKVYSGSGIDAAQLRRHILKGWESVVNRIPQTIKDVNGAMGIAEKYQRMQGGSTSGGMYMAGSTSGGKILGGNYQSRF